MVSQFTMSPQMFVQPQPQPATTVSKPAETRSEEDEDDTLEQLNAQLHDMLGK